MKKTLFFALIINILLVSCKDDTPQPQPEVGLESGVFIITRAILRLEMLHFRIINMMVINS